MEAVVGLFVIVMLVALLSGAGRRDSGRGERPARYVEVAPPPRSTAVASEGGSGSLVPALVLLLTIVALFFGMR